MFSPSLSTNSLAEENPILMRYTTNNTYMAADTECGNNITRAIRVRFTIMFIKTLRLLLLVRSKVNISVVLILLIEYSLNKINKFKIIFLDCQKTLLNNK